MHFTETKLKGAYLIELDKKADERGFFARAWCQKEFQARNLPPRFVQCNVSWNKRKGTLRGMHRQKAPHEESKLIRCTRGAIYDVILDLRRDSQTFGNWLGFELTQDNHRSLFVPGGFAVGFQTLEDASEVLYLMSEFYAPGAEEGVRYNDPAFRIEWPTELTVISEKDKGWPDYPNDPQKHGESGRA
jgi:dTDP-4-dehydrorhamnose 3,5-epimerase